MKVVDMHCDTVLRIYDEGGSLLENDFNIDLKKMLKGDYLLQNFAMFVNLNDSVAPLIKAQQLIDLYYNEINKHPDIIKPIFSYQDIIDNQNAGLMSAMLTLEEGAVVNHDLAILRNYYRLGVRMITLTWNYPNGIGYPNLSNANDHHDLFSINTKDGLTDFGIEYVKEMERLGIIIDVSHLSDAGFYDVLKDFDADIFCIQETKMQEGQIEIEDHGYYLYMNSAVKKGYSGTLVFTKVKPLSYSYGINNEEHDQEGRVITLEYDNFYLVNCYTPNSQDGLKRLEYRQVWEDDFLAYLKSLEEKKPVILCGDLNVAHQEIDLKNPKTNRKNAGFSDEERAKMTQLLNHGFIDTFRYLYPDLQGAYSWWSYRFNARKNNAGWRIDYFIVSDCLKEKIKDAYIFKDIMGSDHCPVGLDIELD